MCKYCKFTYSIGDRERSALKNLMTHRDGVDRFTLDLFRTVVTEDDNSESREAVLAFVQDIKIGARYEEVTRKEITIKYCPFCGEEL